MQLKRSSNKKLAGVCAGIAEHFGWDITITRIAYALATLFLAGFPGIILYAILAFIMPEK
jgi:phage shock protein C